MANAKTIMLFASLMTAIRVIVLKENV